jgi:hypothetical protein
MDLCGGYGRLSGHRDFVSCRRVSCGVRSSGVNAAGPAAPRSRETDHGGKRPETDKLTQDAANGENRDTKITAAANNAAPLPPTSDA